MDKELNALDRVATLRPDDLIPLSHEGEEGKNMTAEDFKIAMGMDYSSLDEQAIPGRKLMGVDGVARQAYVRTFVGTTHPDIGGYYHVLNNVAAFILLGGEVQPRSYGGGVPAGMSLFTDLFAWNIYRFSDGAVVMRVSGSAVTNVPYCVTIIYAKNQ